MIIIYRRRRRGRARVALFWRQSRRPYTRRGARASATALCLRAGCTRRWYTPPPARPSQYLAAPDGSAVGRPSADPYCQQSARARAKRASIPSYRAAPRPETGSVWPRRRRPPSGSLSLRRRLDQSLVNREPCRSPTARAHSTNTLYSSCPLCARFFSC